MPQQAAKLAPCYPANLLNLIETRLQWKDSNAARRELKALDALWLGAQTNFTGVKWESSWADWTARRQKAHQELDEPPTKSGVTNR